MGFLSSWGGPQHCPHGNPVMLRAVEGRVLLLCMGHLMRKSMGAVVQGSHADLRVVGVGGFLGKAGLETELWETAGKSPKVKMLWMSIINAISFPNCLVIRNE